MTVFALTLFWFSILLVAATCVLSSYFDIKDQIVPNWIIVTSTLLGVALLTLRNVMGENACTLPISPVHSIYGGLACFSTLFPLWLIGKSGGGDVKLCTVLGFILGPIPGLTIILLASSFAALVVLCSLGTRFLQNLWLKAYAWQCGVIRNRYQMDSNARITEVPMAGYFALATFIVLLPQISNHLP